MSTTRVHLNLGIHGLTTGITRDATPHVLTPCHLSQVCIYFAHLKSLLKMNNNFNKKCISLHKAKIQSLQEIYNSMLEHKEKPAHFR